MHLLVFFFLYTTIGEPQRPVAGSARSLGSNASNRASARSRSFLCGDYRLWRSGASQGGVEVVGRHEAEQHAAEWNHVQRGDDGLREIVPGWTSIEVELMTCAHVFLTEIHGQMCSSRVISFPCTRVLCVTIRIHLVVRVIGGPSDWTAEGNGNDWFKA